MQRFAHSAVAAIVIAAVSAPAAPAAPAAPRATIAAVWKPHKITFTFIGFTTHYSCDGFENTVDRLLLAAGARPDAKVVASCTAPSGRPERISLARLSFSVLVPADAKGAPNSPAGSKPVEAQWKTVYWRAHSPLALDLGEGDCELVDHFARRILPLFTVRDVVNGGTCVPHQVDLGSVDLKFQVLAPALKSVTDRTRGT
ncbi:MAG TPA: hypothetical protein VMU86_00510 [Steroidobacteraceae bacterium]|nr:hypothetical protein [Steroidobacteraceae bacterium]